MSDERFYHRDRVQHALLNTRPELETAPAPVRLKLAIVPAADQRPASAFDGYSDCRRRNVQPVRQRGQDDRLTFAPFRDHFEVILLGGRDFHAKFGCPVIGTYGRRQRAPPAEPSLEQPPLS